MPLDVQRLRDSELVSDASAQEFRAAVLLWCAAWHQVPAASLPDKDTTLARLAGYGQSEQRAWRKVRDGALRGFVLCSDGRLYHPVVAEKAMDAWAERQEFKSARSADNTRKKREREWRAAATDVLRKTGIVLDFNVTTAELRRRIEGMGLLVLVDDSGAVSVTSPRDCHGQATAMTEKGQGQLRDRDSEGTGTVEAFTSTAARAVDGNDGAGAKLVAALGAAVGMHASAGDPEIARAVEQGITAQELSAAAAGMPGKPVRYYVQRAIGRRADAATGSSSAPGAAAAAPKDPAAEARAKRRRAIEDEIIHVRHCADRGFEEWPVEAARERIAELQTELAELTEGALA